jgi:hypothetical protein
MVSTDLAKGGVGTSRSSDVRRAPDFQVPGMTDAILHFADELM